MTEKALSSAIEGERGIPSVNSKKPGVGKAKMILVVGLLVLVGGAMAWVNLAPKKAEPAAVDEQSDRVRNSVPPLSESMKELEAPSTSSTEEPTVDPAAAGPASVPSDAPQDAPPGPAFDPLADLSERRQRAPLMAYSTGDGGSRTSAAVGGEAESASESGSLSASLENSTVRRESLRAMVLARFARSAALVLPSTSADAFSYSL